MGHSDWECRDMVEMYTHYMIPIRFEPGLLTDKEMQDRVNYLFEEVHELADAVARGDLAEVADALVDIVVYAKGTAVMMNLPWEQLWQEVKRANMEKQPGENAKRPGFTHDLVKPEGWVPPRIQEVLDGSL